jgi:hypothetical protein
LEYFPCRLKKEAERVMANEMERIYNVVQRRGLDEYIAVNGSPLRERRVYRPTVSLTGRFNATIHLSVE